MYSNAQKKQHIYELQSYLRRVQQAEGNPYPLMPNGIWGKSTAASLQHFQKQNQLPVTGTADFSTWSQAFEQYATLSVEDSLPSAVVFFPTGNQATLSLGARNSAVAALQLILNTAVPHFSSLSPLPLTGEYDTATRDAVQQMQKYFQLPETGIVDRATWEMLARLHNHLFYRTPLQWTIAESESKAEPAAT